MLGCVALRVGVCCSVLQSVAPSGGRDIRCMFVGVFWSVLECVAMCCSVLECVGVCWSVLECVAMCCSVL